MSAPHPSWALPIPNERNGSFRTLTGWPSARVLLLIGLSLAATTLTASAAPKTSTAAGSGPIARVTVAPVHEQELRATTTGFGQVQAQPAKVMSINAPEAATVVKVFVRPGQTVKQGDPVAQLSPAPSTQEAFRKAQTARDFARTKLERTRYLWKRGATTRDLLDQAEIAYRNAQASLESLKSTGAQQAQQSITAPIVGTVTAVSVAEGDRVAQNAKILSMTPVDALAVLLGVEPEDVGKVRVGMPATLRSASDNNAGYSGKVSAINEIIDPQTRLVDVMVDIENADGHPPLIGTEMRGEIELRRERTLVVPRAAILYNPSRAYIFIVKNGLAHRVSVTPGLDGHGLIGITGPIKSGDTVVVQGNYELEDGMKVEQVPHAVP